MEVTSEQNYLRIASINIYVSDLERSLRFYVDQLGFNQTFHAQIQSGAQWMAVAPPDGTAVLALIEAGPGTREHQFVGRATHVVLMTENVIAKFHEWRMRGVRFGHTPKLRRVKFERQSQPPAPGSTDGVSESVVAWGGVFTRFKDPDGNSFALVGIDEVSREIDEQRRAAAERLEAERRATQELEIARQVQARLFPQNLPPLKTLEYAGTCIQARKVGGDYYDFLDFGRSRMGLIIGDIAGKGIAASLLMANLQANLRSQCAIALGEPSGLLRSVNQLFYRNTGEGAYATLFFSEYDDEERKLRYANCGHLSALLLRGSGDLERLSSTSTVVGLFEDWDCEISECQLMPGDVLALYTDGVTEACNEAEEEFGEDRLVQTMLGKRDLPPKSLVQSVVDEVARFSPGEQYDDITMIVAKCTG